MEPWEFAIEKTLVIIDAYDEWCEEWVKAR